MRRPLPASLLACAALAALAPACGGGEDDGPLGKLRAAAREDNDLGLRYYLRVIAKTGSRIERFRGYGQVEAGGKRSRVVSTNTEGEAHELVRDGRYLYANIVPGVDASGGGVWIKLKASGAGDGDGQDLGALALFDAFSPSEALELLLGLDPGVKRDGEEFLRDIHTERYRVTVKRGPLSDAFRKRAGGEQLELTGAAREQVIPAVVWIDGQGRVRRARVRLGDAAESLVLTTQVTAYTDVSVRVPSGKDIVDGTE